MLSSKLSKGSLAALRAPICANNGFPTRTLSVFSARKGIPKRGDDEKLVVPEEELRITEVKENFLPFQTLN